MKRLIIMAALTVAAFGFNEANAQKVIKDAAGNVFIDVQDMLAGTFSNSSLNVIQRYDNTGNSVFKKLQIAKEDITTTSWANAVGLSTSYNTSNAVGQQQGSVDTGCKAYSAEGNAGKWRVPTQKELILMYVLKDVLVQAGAKQIASNYYNTWSSTQENNTNSYAIDFANGRIHSSNSKTSGTPVRCVREVN